MKFKIFKYWKIKRCDLLILSDIILQLGAKEFYGVSLKKKGVGASAKDPTILNKAFDTILNANPSPKVKKLQADLASGKVHSFTGPIYDQKGNLMVAEGKTADDGMLAGMMTYVKGVEGDIPK